MKQKQEAIARLRKFLSNDCVDTKLCDDIRYLCDEVERLSDELATATNHMDDDYDTIQKYKNKLTRCQNRLVNYEPF